eukprot:6497214-Prymnesium_polylepis.1
MAGARQRNWGGARGGFQEPVAHLQPPAAHGAPPARHPAAFLVPRTPASLTPTARGAPTPASSTTDSSP